MPTFRAFIHLLINALFLASSLFLGSLTYSTTSLAQSAADTALYQHINQLTTTHYAQKMAAIESIGKSGHPDAAPILSALLEGRLFFTKKEKWIVIAHPTDPTEKRPSVFETFHPISGAALGKRKSRALKKVRTNNRIRSSLQSYIASLQLTHSDPNIQISAARSILKAPNADFLPHIKEALLQEENSDVLQALLTTKAAIELKQTKDIELKISAIQILKKSLEPEVLAQLIQLNAKDPDGNPLEASERLRAEAAAAVTHIKERTAYYKVMENLFFGLSLGSVLLLASIGLAITFGVMGVINMAHGEMIMLGAYTTYVIQLLLPHHIEQSLFIAIPAAFIVSGAVGIIIERSVVRHLYGRPLETLLATFGISLILQQLVRSIFSPLNRSVSTPEWMSGSLEINPILSLTYNRLYIILFAIATLLLLWSFIKYSRFGLSMRAVTQNREMARALGIRSSWVDALTFGLGSGIAGIAGVALSQLTNVGPNLGQNYIIDSFMVVVFGGVGNLMGTFVAAMSLGMFNKFLEPFTGAVMAKILLLIFIIIFIQRRPKGLFALKGRTAEEH